MLFAKPIMTLTEIIFLFALAVTPLQAQNSVYVESWKKGNGKIQNQTVTVDLNTSKPKFETKIKDADRNKNYRLVVSLTFDKSNRPSSGYVELVDKALIGFNGTNLLKPSNDPYQDYFTGADYIAVLDPAMQGNRCAIENGCAPFFSKRVVKVKGFYCIVQVLNYNQSPASISVRIEFANNVDDSLIQQRI
jgi:hypothetical protein